MELDEVIRKRHSCRTYLPTPVSNEVIYQIVEAGRLAPSSKNKQPWKIVCLKTAIKSTSIAQIMKDYYIKNKDNPEISGSMYATGKILEDCPAILLIFSDSEFIDRLRVEDISSLLSIGAAVEHMVLKATDLGLGSLWIADTYFVQKEIGELIDKEFEGDNRAFITQKNRLVCAVAIGEMGDQVYPTPRKNLDEILKILEI